MRRLSLPLIVSLPLLLARCSSEEASPASAGASGQANAAGKGGSSAAGAGGGVATGGAVGVGGSGAGVGGSGAGVGGSGASGGAGVGGGGGICQIDPQLRQGEGTFYDATGAGNCSFPATPNDLMVGAMNQTDYAGSAACGTCAQVDGPQGSVLVRIVDRCPECKPGDIDLSPQAFEKLAPLEKGRIPISWRYTPCPVQGPVVYHFKDGSNQWWTAVQVRNHRNPIASFAYKAADGSFKDVQRLDYNFFVATEGMGPGPYTFRVTDTLGNVIEDSNIPAKDNDDSPGAQQFPGCGG